MPVVGCFGPAVILDAERLPEVDEFLSVALGQGGHVHAFLIGGLLHFLAVLIDPSQEEHLVAAQATVASDDIGEDFFVGMSDVGRAIGLVNGGGDEKLGHVRGVRDWFSSEGLLA